MKSLFLARLSILRIKIFKIVFILISSSINVKDKERIMNNNMSYRQYLQYIAVFFDNFNNIFMILFKF